MTALARAAGHYLYVGSAQRNLQARLARRHKALSWQIDNLSMRAEFIGALLVGSPKNLECKLAVMLTKPYLRAALRFGASNCRCGGHLFRVE